MTNADLDLVASDPSMAVAITLNLAINNRELTPEQRRMLHGAMVKAAKRMGAQLALAVDDPNLIKMSLTRMSSARGQMKLELAEEEPVDG